MTNKERLISLLGFDPGNDKAIEGALADASLTAGDVYVSGNKNTVKLAAIEVMELILTTPDITNTEGQGLRYDRDAVLKRLRQFKIDVGLIKDEGPAVITNKSYLW